MSLLCPYYTEFSALPQVVSSRQGDRVSEDFKKNNQTKAVEPHGVLAVCSL